MSGGHWDYVQQRIQNDLETVAQDPEVQQRWPMLAQMLGELSESLYETLRAMDWDLSYDSPIPDDTAFDQQAVEALLDIILKPRLTRSIGPEDRL